MRDLAPVLIAELKRHGVESYRLEQGGKHKKLIFEHGGRELTYVFSATLSDGRRGRDQALTCLRRVMGVKRVIRKSTRQKRRRIRSGAPLPQLPRITPKPDPFERLPELLDPDRPYLEW